MEAGRIGAIEIGSMSACRSSPIANGVRDCVASVARQRLVIGSVVREGSTVKTVAPPGMCHAGGGGGGGASEPSQVLTKQRTAGTPEKANTWYRRSGPVGTDVP